MYPGQLDILLDKSGSTILGHNPNLSGSSQHCCRPAKRYLSNANLDITLLRCLLVNFANNCQTNSTLRQDIEDPVKYRNKLYGHAQEARCSDSDYTKYKIDVEGVILRIARFCKNENDMRQKLNDASERPMDETILQQYQNTLIQQMLCEKNIEEKLDDLQQQLTVQDEKLHCRMDTIDGKVNELAGGGKSKTSLQIAMIYQDKSYKPMLFVNDEITRNRDLINFDDKHIIIVEDLFGRSNINFNEDLHRGILDVLYACIKRKSCTSNLIITIRGNEEINRNLIEKQKIFDKDVLINIDTKRCWGCHAMILSKHMNKHDISLCKCKQVNYALIYNLPPVAIERCILEVVETKENAMQLCVSVFNDIFSGKYEMKIGFRQACHLFCSNKNLTKQASFYFTRASKSLVNEKMDFKIKGFDSKLVQYQYCVLVYTAMKNAIDVYVIDEKCFKNILSYFESHTIKISFLREAVRTLIGTYFTQKSSISDRGQTKRLKFSEVYVLQHYIIQEAILVSYGDDVDVLSFCEFSFLLEYLCKDIMINFGLTVFLSFCTPIVWTNNNSNFVEIETDVLMKALYSTIVCIKLDENYQESKDNKRNFTLFFTLSELAISNYAVGNYIYANLIAKDFLDIVEKLFTSLKQNARKISAIHAKEFLDGLLNEEKRSKIEYIDRIADFCLEHGLRSNNDKFVRSLYEQLVSERDEKSLNDHSESNLDNEKNRNDDDENRIYNYTKVMFDDYPNDELGEDENGRILHIRVRLGVVKSVYSENNRVYPFRRTYSRLCRFLSNFMTYGLFGNITEFKRMAIIQQKMKFLYSSITPDQELSDSDDSDEYFG
ncbi:unnamed protein product [Mytilus coruscus]|uniref:Uncharacterized protein n=1 Tax=Mytilus coruscus TaxID=42192 RepID=A0A6J8DH39_MYTCO|nr:unnamed protein product [Mytilus coruscus]